MMHGIYQDRGLGAPADLTLIDSFFLEPKAPDRPARTWDESSGVDAGNTEDAVDARRYEQIALDEVLRQRNRVTLIPSSWEMYFNGIPLPEGLYYKKTKSASVRPRIYARTDRFEYRGAESLRKLISLNARVRYEYAKVRDKREQSEKVRNWMRELEKTIDKKGRQIASAENKIRRLEEQLAEHSDDAEAEDYLNTQMDQVNARVAEAQNVIDRSKSALLQCEDRDEIIQQHTSVCAAEVTTMIQHSLKEVVRWSRQDGDLVRFAGSLPENMQIMVLDDENGEGVGRDKLRNQKRRVQNQMRQNAIEWRSFYAGLPATEGEQEAPEPPVLFSFVIRQRIVLIVTLDAADPNASISTLCRLDMEEHTQAQWNALGIMATVCWARDCLMAAYRDIPISAIPSLAVQPESEDIDA
ncbi:hypothetical protein F4780DRAFT_167822 [Xylariomycetidae sp. FL0641]|nr:hypothetical protein F4780DRAFT_167822 [Xylariomycetidae sp. FL0641]